MDDIVLQLQSDALDSKQNTGMLLRKSFLIAKKLKLSDFGDWVTAELNGYGVDEKIPEYRKVKGSMKFRNPYYGWCPVVFPSTEMEQALTVIPIHEPIHKIQELLSEEGSIRTSVPPDIIAEFAKSDPSASMFEYNILFDKSSFANIVELVRTKILDWALLLEEKGIRGENLSFSKEEIDSAGDPTVIHYTNNFFSSVNDTQIQQGSSDSSQNQ